MSSLFNLATVTAAGGHRLRAGYRIDRSVRFRSSASASFSRTPASASNRTTWTWSGWVKRGNLENTNPIFGASVDANTLTSFNFNSTGTLRFYRENSGIVIALGETTAVYRDPSSWYHIVCAYDSTQATLANRLKIYVNEVQQAFAWSTNLPLNHESNINNNQLHSIGTSPQYVTSFDGYLTEVNFIDGQALTPASFGETNILTGVWQPKKYTGTYGTNGFYLNFSDNSAATAAAIGKDSSGNGNNWTPNNISVSAGVTYDSMLDSPTQFGDGGNGRGNYFTLNPLAAAGYTPYSDGNLKFTSPATVTFSSVFTITGGKWYYEYFCNSIATPANFRVGRGAFYFANGNIFVGSVIATVASYTTNDTIGVAADVDADTVSFYKNGVLQGTYSGPQGGVMAVNFAAAAPDSASFNFGQRPFSYTPPDGFKALNTLNLP